MKTTTSKHLQHKGLSWQKSSRDSPSTRLRKWSIWLGMGVNFTPFANNKNIG